MVARPPCGVNGVAGPRSSMARDRHARVRLRL